MAKVRDLIPIKARQNRVIVCETMNFLWDEPELREMAVMWERDTSLQIIAKHFDRDPDEVIFALIHLGRAGKIERRKGGLFA